MNEHVRRGLLRTPYRLRGRDAEGVDCLGVVWFIQTHERKQTLPDPWQSVEQQWRARGTFDASTGLPDTWQKVDGPPKDGDIMLFDGEHVWCATVHEGHVWSAHPKVGVWCKSLAKFEKKPKELWRQC